MNTYILMKFQEYKTRSINIFCIKITSSIQWNWTSRSTNNIWNHEPKRSNKPDCSEIARNSPIRWQHKIRIEQLFFIFPHAETYMAAQVHWCWKYVWKKHGSIEGNLSVVESVWALDLASSWVASSRIQPSLLLNYLCFPKSILCNSVYNVYGISSTSVQSGTYGSKLWLLWFSDILGFYWWVSALGKTTRIKMVPISLICSNIIYVQHSPTQCKFWPTLDTLWTKKKVENRSLSPSKVANQKNNTNTWFNSDPSPSLNGIWSLWNSHASGWGHLWIPAKGDQRLHGRWDFFTTLQTRLKSSTPPHKKTHI